MKRGAHEHPKVSALMERLDLPLYAATGLLEMLWHYAAKFTPAGDIGRWSDAQIARFVGWDREPSELVAALVDAGWIDRHEEHRLVVHDWSEHADDAVHMALARARRCFADGNVPRLARLPKEEKERAEAHYAAVSTQKSKRDRTSIRAHGVRTASARREQGGEGECSRRDAALPCPTKPFQALPEEHAPAPAARDPEPDDGFEVFWSAYPRKVDKADARRAWAKLHPDAALQATIVAALATHAATPQWLDQGGRFIPHAATWLNKRRWEAEVTPLLAQPADRWTSPKTAGNVAALQEFANARR